MPVPRLVILDLNLPKVSGGQVLERVRQSSRCASVPVLVLTSSDSPKDKAEVARFGATKYFRKSSRLDEFMNLGVEIRNLLEKEDFCSQASGEIAFVKSAAQTETGRLNEKVEPRPGTDTAQIRPPC